MFAKFLKSFGQFWYDLIIGDDWKIPVAVVIALAVVLGVHSAHLLGDTGTTILGGVLIIAAFTVSLLIDVRPQRRR
jgi:hypothetical protein